WSGAPSSADLATINGLTRRGYTGHEMLDSTALIHMNGRVQDPLLGRFVSADPNVDAGLGTQGWNRYSYVGNKPLSRVDPSGFYSRGMQRRARIGGDDSNLDWLELAQHHALLRWGGAATIADGMLATRGTDSRIDAVAQQQVASVMSQLRAVVKSNPSLGSYASQLLSARGYAAQAASFSPSTSGSNTPKRNMSIWNADQSECLLACSEADSTEQDGRSASTTIGSIGALASGIEYSLPKVTVGSNGRVYWSGWKGGSRARIMTYSVAEGAKIVGASTLILGTAIDVAGVLDGSLGVDHASINLGVGLWGLTAGPFTAAPAILYFAIDNFYPGGGIGFLQDKAAVDSRMIEIDPSWMHPGSH
ncbi:MAG: RHS repeat-associated core domain-containing protein, partial [Steroidobacteraceae bacterium]